MKILLVTNMFPTVDRPDWGTFVLHQVQSLRDLGHDVDIVNIRGYRSRLAYVRGAWEVVTRRWCTRYDVVHAHYGLSGYPALLCWRTPLVITLHGSDALLGGLHGVVNTLVCRWADAVITVARHMADRISTRVIPCGVDLQVFRPMDRREARDRLNLPDDRRFILFPFDPRRAVKRYDRAKAVEVELQRRGYAAELLVATGIPNDQMPWCYSAADVMLLCSDREGSPTSVKEALACNLPVVSTDVGDVADILDGIRGVAIADGDAGSLADAIESVLCEKHRSNFDGRTAMERYGQSHLTRQIVEVYEQLTSGR